ncbi:hypothetical protein GCK72_009820 [Caenorhabditis remanei]|uniref:Uncharacterized protein n=1 Tax=Caenorhabditis remanei TaxID=31234 RepID=A0A6A5H493_CAERE|nr:hypothetical protein GCK72_009820 [Caenorhabditis remanei]KAF1761564.1 hypothetical protein GCK72_009820 [Caenorhabditis remanei]
MTYIKKLTGDEEKSGLWKLLQEDHTLSLMTSGKNNQDGSWGGQVRVLMRLPQAPQDAEQAVHGLQAFQLPASGDDNLVVDLVKLTFPPQVAPYPGITCSQYCPVNPSGHLQRSQRRGSVYPPR